jgi:BirA family biotin operon repressor/biotin-[acetyl-CoA-carboxylase] ligase
MRDKILEILDSGGFISGEVLAEKLNVSRTAIWKQIKALRNLGYDIESIKNKGYHLLSRPDIPIFEEVSKDLNTKIIGCQIKYFKTLDSTNLFAKNLVKNNISEGFVVVADIQEKGRGRKDRTWSSLSGGLWFSVILYPNIPSQSAMIITMTFSVSIAQAIESITNINSRIKWPNDILIDNKKVCGVLTELDAEIDRVNYAIVGVGLNVNNKLERGLSKSAITLSKKIGKEVSRVELFKNILKKLDENYAKLISGNFTYLRNLWLSYSNIIGKKVLIIQERNTFKGIVSNVDDTGCLIVKTSKGDIRILSGDIEFL